MPHDLEMPEDFAEEGQDENLKYLLDDSFNSIEKEVGRQFFIAFGALTLARTTSNFLASYFNIGPNEAEYILDRLVRRSLVERNDIIIGEETIGIYAIHDLAFSYARMKFRNKGEDLNHCMKTVLRYLPTYMQDILRLEVDLPNVLGSIGHAEPDDLVRIILYLAVGGYPSRRVPVILMSADTPRNC